LARTEPFRSLLQMAAGLVETPAPTPPPVIFDEDAERVPFERRLDAVVLPAGATPPRGMRGLAFQALGLPPLPPQPLVPLRLDPPSPIAAARPEHAGRPLAAFEPLAAPPGVLLDEPTRPDLRLPFDAARPGAGQPLRADGIRAQLRRLASLHTGRTPPRPLPAVGAATSVDLTAKVITVETLAQHGVSVCAFSSRDTDEGDVIDVAISVDEFDDAEFIAERSNRAAAAVALAALSDEGPGEVDPFDAYADIAAAGFDGDLDVLAEALGLGGGVAVPRMPATTGATAVEATVEDDEVLYDGVAVEVDECDIEDVDVAAGFAAGDAHPLTSSATAPASLPDDDEAGFLDEDEVTPARGTKRPAMPTDAVRVVVAEAPARPRHEALSADERERNGRRAHELYLVALDDVGDGDLGGAIGHLQLAVAYDDQTDVYRELLAQLSRRARRAG